MRSITFVLTLLAGALLSKLAERVSTLWRPKPCVDLFSGAPRPVVYSVQQLYQGDYGRKGLAHITVAGAWHHGMKRTEVWLQTFAPGVRTPVHRHDCEEVFVIQRGGGTAFFRAADGSVQEVAFQQNDTLVIPPNVVHQIVNTGEQEDMQALVVFDSPPISIHTFTNFSTPDRQAVLQAPYYWDRSCPPTLPDALALLQRLQDTGSRAQHEL